MNRRHLNPLGETEMELLQHVWALGSATVADVHERVLATREVAYTTVMTVLKKLADKGYLQYVKDGHAYVYSAARPPEEVRHSLLSGLLDRVFQGSARQLVQTLVRNEPLSDEEADAIRAIVAEMGQPDEDADA